MHPPRRSARTPDIRHANAALLSITHELPPEVVQATTSMSSWPKPISVCACRRACWSVLQVLALAAAGPRARPSRTAWLPQPRRLLRRRVIDRSQIGLLINASVTRDNFEPAVSVGVHDRLELPRHALNFDITNACLGFVNAMTVASTMIDAGAIDYALIVAGEDPPVAPYRGAHSEQPDSTREDVLAQFATLTSVRARRRL